MPKAKSPYYSISSLKGLEYLYNKMRKIDPTKLKGGRYVEEVQQHLYNDNVGVGSKSRNFVNKFLSQPDGKEDEVSGIDMTVLDEIVKKIYVELGLEKIFPEIGDIGKHESPASIFEDIIFPTPDYLEVYNEKKYFQYLSAEVKIITEAYVKRRMYELDQSVENIKTFCVYEWSNNSRNVRCSILSLNLDTYPKTAMYSYFTRNNTPKGVMRSLRYSHENTILSLDMVEEDPLKHHMRSSFFLSLLDVESTDFVKGVLSVTGRNATLPISCEVILEKCTSYYEAYQKVVTPSNRKAQLSLEVKNRRFDIEETNIYSLDRLRSFPLYKILEEISGFYIIFYITQMGSTIGKGMLQKGLCHIDLNGLVLFEFPAIKNKFQGYVEEHLYRASNFVSISFFNTQPSDIVDTHYKLQIERDYKNDGKLTGLNGFYSSFSLNTIYSGRIAYLRTEDQIKSGQKMDEIFEELKKKYGIGIPINMKEKSPDSLTDIDKEGYKYVTDTKYDH